MKYYKYIQFLIIVLTIAGCSKDDEVTPTIETLDTSEKQFDRTQSEIESLANSAGFGSLVKYLEYDINVYKVTYKSTYLDQEIIASGLVTLPETDQAMPLLSFQHGTIANHSGAPTQNLAQYGFLSNLASAGYIFCVPDYIGFGSSSDLLHPYYHAPSTADAVVDLLKAAKELAELEGYSTDGRVFLSGYSEGGYATMAAHKTLEEQKPEGFTLVASAPASGGYDIKGMQEYFFSLETYGQPFYIAYVALAYTTIYEWTQPLSDYFQEPYASAIPGYFDGTLSGYQINNQLTTSVTELFQSDILSNIDNDPKYAHLVNAFEENSLDEWIPQTRMIMYHGTADITVPYQNSVDTYNNMIEIGASGDIITFIPLEGETHATGFNPYLSGFIEAFDGMK